MVLRMTTSTLLAPATPALRSGDIVEVTLADHAAPLTAIVVAGNCDGEYLFDIIDSTGRTAAPILAHSSEVTSVRTFDPDTTVRAA